MPIYYPPPVEKSQALFMPTRNFFLGKRRRAPPKPRRALSPTPPQERTPRHPGEIDLPRPLSLYNRIRARTREAAHPAIRPGSKTNPPRVEGQPGPTSRPTRGGQKCKAPQAQNEPAPTSRRTRPYLETNPGRMRGEPGAGRGLTRGGSEINPRRMRKRTGARTVPLPPPPSRDAR